MTRQSRRAFLAGSASGLAALAGCANLPVVGDEDSRIDYDEAALREAAASWSFEAPETYPAPVPDELAAAHYERAQALVEDVPSDPSFPNEAVTERFRDQYGHVAEALSTPPAPEQSLDTLDGWRYDRGRAAEVRGAYEAATGAASRSDYRQRRESVRRSVGSFQEQWAHRGGSPVEAFAVHRQIEQLVAQCERLLVADRSFPSDPQSSVFVVGELVGDLERARAALSDAAELRDAYVTSGMDAHWSDLARAAVRLERATHPTRRRVEPYVQRDARPSDFQRNVEGTPALRLYQEVRREATLEDFAEAAMNRGEYASAVSYRAGLLTGLVAMRSVVDAVEDGDYGVPESVQAVVDQRESAVAATADALAVEPTSVSAVVASSAWRRIRRTDTELYQRTAEGSQSAELYEGDVVDAVGQYATAEHLAAAVPPVVDRVTEELRGSE